jgi:hypothetical protein
MRARFGHLLLMALAGLAIGQPVAAAQSGIPPSKQRALLREAKRVATLDGDSHPYDIEAVLTTRAWAIGAGAPVAAPAPGEPAWEPACERPLPPLRPEPPPGASPAPTPPARSASCAGAPWYVLAMRGHFTCNTCSEPLIPGIKYRPLVGTVITLGMEARYPHTSYFGFGSPYPDLQNAGTPIRLDKARPHRRHEGARRGRPATHTH